MVRTFDATFLPRSDLHKFTSNTLLKAAWKSGIKQERQTKSNYVKGARKKKQKQKINKKCDSSSEIFIQEKQNKNNY